MIKFLQNKGLGIRLASKTLFKHPGLKSVLQDPNLTLSFCSGS